MFIEEVLCHNQNAAHVLVTLRVCLSLSHQPRVELRIAINYTLRRDKLPRGNTLLYCSRKIVRDWARRKLSSWCKVHLFSMVIFLFSSASTQRRTPCIKQK